MKRNVLLIGVPMLLAGCAASETEQLSVPAGQVTLGDPTEVRSDAPLKLSSVEAFSIDKYEVTNRQYRACVDDGACQTPFTKGFDTVPDYYGNTDYADYPVAFVTWFQAQAYCEWKGGRLPTEAEWEYAARGEDGRIYPWGNTEPSCDVARYGDCLNDSGLSTPAKVGSFEKGASAIGAMDMGGNMAEWVYDWYDKDSYARLADGDTWTSPEGGISKSVRGGSWWCEAFRLDTSRREPKVPMYRAGNLGFRCVK